MALSLNKEILAGAYDYLCTTPPFRNWNLPEGEDVVFKITRDPKIAGFYQKEKKTGRHIIGVSGVCIGRTATLMELMAHEMTHLHQACAGMASGSQHNAAFRKLAQSICKVHGFDPRMF